MARAKAAGVANHLLEGVTAKELVTAVELAAAGKPPSSSRGFGKLVSQLDAPEKPCPGALSITPRESQVLQHIALGLSNEEIARSLAISIETVKEHVANLLRKLKVPDRTAAAVWAVRAGVV